MFRKIGRRLMLPHIILRGGFTFRRPGRRRLPLAPRRQLMEALTRLGESRSLAAGDLATANDHVDIERIELDAPTDAAGRLRSYEGRSGAEERVKHDVAPIGEIKERVFQHARVNAAAGRLKVWSWGRSRPAGWIRHKVAQPAGRGLSAGITKCSKWLAGGYSRAS